MSCVQYILLGIIALHLMSIGIILTRLGEEKKGKYTFFDFFISLFFLNLFIYVFLEVSK